MMTDRTQPAPKRKLPPPVLERHFLLLLAKLLRDYSDRYDHCAPEDSGYERHVSDATFVLPETSIHQLIVRYKRKVFSVTASMQDVEPKRKKAKK